jgi:hypothetical protein
MLPAPAAQAGHRSAACYPGGSRTVVANDLVRVYGVPSTDPDAQGTRRLVACSLSSGRRQALGGNDGCSARADVIPEIRLSGRMVGYVRADCIGYLASVIVRNMATGGAIVDEPVAPGRGHQVTDFEIKPNGSAVWIVGWKNAEYENDLEGRLVQVLEVATDRHPRTVDDSLGIVPGSLALGRARSGGTSRFYWEKAGALYSGSVR